MNYSLDEQYALLKQYLDYILPYSAPDVRATLGEKAPSLEHIQNCENELQRLQDELQARAQQTSFLNLSNAQQMTFNLFPAATPAPQPVATPQPQKAAQQKPSLQAALPTSPAQTVQQTLKATTIFTPLPSIVSFGYNQKHRGINWSHYENMLKLFALSYMYHGQVLTQQQEKDKADLEQAIEEAGNAKYKKKHLTAEQIMKRDEGVYMRYGQNVIRAMAEPDPLVSERRLKDLRSEIPDTRVSDNAIQLHKMMSKAKTIAMVMRARYSNKKTK